MGSKNEWFNQKNMKKIIEPVIKVLIYISFFVPLVVMPASFIFPFIVPKILIFRSLVTVMLGGYVLLLIINWQEYKPKFTGLNIVLLAFLSSFTLSTFLGTDAYHSFWDNHERMLGLFTIFHYIAYYFICSAVFKNWTEWKLALKIFLMAGSIVMVLAMVQKVDPNFLMNQGSPRTSSTLGNSIYVGGYALFLMFTSFLLLTKEKTIFWKVVLGGLGLMSFLGMMFSGTRGSMLGFLAGIFILLVGYSITLKTRPKIRNFSLAILAIGVALLGVMYLNRGNDVVKNIPLLGRLLNSSLTEGTGSTRLIAWNIAVESWKERPIFGWGPNNFFYAFNKYYNPKSLEYGYGETWFDNAHNIILNTLAVQGLFGLLCYLSIFVIAILTLWRDKDLKEKNLHLVVIGSAFLVAHLVQNFTVFENPTSYLYFMFWLAMINRLSQSPTEQQVVEGKLVDSKTADREIKLPALATAGGLVVILVFVFNIQPARANMKTFSAMNALYRDPIVGIFAIKDSLAFKSPHIDDIRSDLARIGMQVLNQASEQMGQDPSNELANVIYDNLKNNLILHPLDIRNHITMAQLGQMLYMSKKDPQYLLSSEKYLDQALTLSPRRQQLIYMSSLFKVQMGKNDEGIKMLEQSISDDPKIAEGYWRLAYVYFATTQIEKAKEILSTAKEKGIVFDAQGQKVVDLIMATSTPKSIPKNKK